MNDRMPFAVSDITTAKEVLRGDVFRVDHPFRTTRKIFGPSVLDTEGALHSQLKRAWVRLFRRTEMEGRIDDIVSHAVKTGFAHARESGELATICMWIPNRIILDLLGRPDLQPEQHYRMIRAAADMLETNSLGTDFESVRHYLHAPTFHAAELFRDLDEESRTREIAVLLVAGVETTIVALEILLHSWAVDPTGFRRRISDKGTMPAVMDLLCVDPPFGSVMRYVQKETRVGSASCPAGTIVNVDIASVEASEPEIAQILFGRGRHQCPGRPLAIRELVLVADRLAGLSPEDYEIQIETAVERPETFRHPGAISVRFRRVGHHTSDV